MDKAAYRYFVSYLPVLNITGNKSSLTQNGKLKIFGYLLFWKPVEESFLKVFRIGETQLLQTFTLVPFLDQRNPGLNEFGTIGAAEVGAGESHEGVHDGLVVGEVGEGSSDYDPA